MSSVSHAAESSVEPLGRRLAEDESSEVPQLVVLRVKKRQRWPLHRLQAPGLAVVEELRKLEFAMRVKAA